MAVVMASALRPVDVRSVLSVNVSSTSIDGWKLHAGVRSGLGVSAPAPSTGALTPNPERTPAWSFQPSIEVDETFTDNTDLTSTGRRADAITTAIPRFYATGEAPALKGVFDYSPQIIDHAVDTTQN